MLEHPAPKGSRSVSWPWYHHCLTNELTPEARIMLEFYSRVPAANIESHIYSIVSSSLKSISAFFPSQVPVCQTMQAKTLVA